MLKHRPYCAQICSQSSRRRICPLPVPLPRSGGGAVWANSCLFKFRSRQRDFLRCTPWPIAVLAALRCPKKSSRCSLARFFRPLRMLRLAASATGGARLRTPYPSPVAGEGPSGQIAACSNFRLGSVTFCGTTTRQNIVPHPRTATPSPPNLHNKSQLQFPSKIRYLCDLRPISSHNVNFPLKKVKY